MVSITARGLGEEAAASRYTRRLPVPVGLSKTGKSARSADPEKPPRTPVCALGIACCTAIGLPRSLRVLCDRLGGLGLVEDAHRQADLLSNPVVAVRLELV